MKKLISPGGRVKRSARLEEAIPNPSNTERINEPKALSSVVQNSPVFSGEEVMLSIKALQIRAEYKSAILEEILNSKPNYRSPDYSKALSDEELLIMLDDRHTMQPSLNPHLS